MKRALYVAVVLLAVICVAGIVTAQSRGRGGRGRGGGGFGGGGFGGRSRGFDISDRRGVPTWDINPHFKSDVFTFVRVRYRSDNSGWRRGGGWDTDAPDSDLNFSFRLQQMTSLKVEPYPKVVELTDPELFNYPFIYLIEPGALEFNEQEVVALRHYLFNGGFLMVDDFWGDDEWLNFYEQIKRVFHNREFTELSLDHPIFHCVFDLKEKPQVPSIGWARHGDPTITTDRPYDPGSRDVHYRAFFDDKNRMVAIICHNTDLGDGWEREGESEAYFHLFAEKRSYPMGINIVFYAMTH